MGARTKYFHSKLRNHAKRDYSRQKKGQVQIYLKHKWFVGTLQRLYEYKKKSNSKEVPDGCYIYLDTLRRLLDLDFDLDKDAIYKLIEISFGREDHKNVIVYSTILPSLTYIRVDCIEFMKWLKDKGYVPCNKHIEHAKKLQKKVDRKKRLAAAGNQSLRQLKLRKSRRLGSINSTAQLQTLAEDDEVDNDDGPLTTTNTGENITLLNLQDIMGGVNIAGGMSSMLDGCNLRGDHEIKGSFGGISGFLGDENRSNFDIETPSISRTNSLIWEDSSDTESEWGICRSDSASDIDCGIDNDRTDSRSS